MSQINLIYKKWNSITLLTVKRFTYRIANFPPTNLSVVALAPIFTTAMLNVLQPPKDLYHTVRETLFVRFVFVILAPFIFVLGTLLRSHYRKVNGERTPGLTRYRQ
ncbi:hypothetical protein PC129_g18943 [Phytophthora cactorum]|uniref:Uncharacterized protein n=1 Tax=Phytophthora cactorum TaxID=29920 RepID=A0A329RZ12_9STRA|nr:hypothetical protein GQ600_10398 [Phytophthora cactorum]KAG3109304.1 hypothetical protein PI125_g11055 [Phytophthora idaei]KAG2773792.1 hypothetical protein Pcac1_g15406 [Phytophthora cactorum]KAG2801370.1 hypothetical protein PC112_g20076 [Phytophthora cactorum]KAG2801928.1 hypothetical protein PC111_g19335 [Phytophthora cactorum]